MEKDSKHYKQLYYRSIHRGCKETDLLFGRFAETELAGLTRDEVKEYETLLEADDSNIWKWFTGLMPLPREFDNAVWQKMKRANHQ